MYSAGGSMVFSHGGFPIRIPTDRRLLTAPRGFSQFCHVLHRLLVPRHPPNALTSLTTRIVASRHSSHDELESLRQMAKVIYKIAVFIPSKTLVIHSICLWDIASSTI